MNICDAPSPSRSQNVAGGIHPETANPATLVGRLRGQYRVPITDGLGPVATSEEPDNPGEFVTTFQTPPIQLAAANRIEELEDALEVMLGATNETALFNEGVFHARLEAQRALAKARPSADQGTGRLASEGEG